MVDVDINKLTECQMETLAVNRLPDKKERARIGKAAERIYEPMRERLEREHWGEYISINVDNGDYAIAPEHLAAVSAIKVKYPGIVPVTIRIGYKAVVHFGGTGVIS